jgi:hypothetical protein
MTGCPPDEEEQSSRVGSSLPQPREGDTAKGQYVSTSHVPEARQRYEIALFPWALPRADSRAIDFAIGIA